MVSAYAAGTPFGAPTNIAIAATKWTALFMGPPPRNAYNNISTPGSDENSPRVRDGRSGARRPQPNTFCRAKEEFIGSRGIVSYKNGRRSTVKFTRIALATALALKQAPVRLHEQTTLAQ
jgi:hypothetical protein